MSATKLPFNSKGPKACLNCRRRKMKCDRKRPSCGSCSKASPAFRDCEYESNTPTRTQRLLEENAHLRSRLASYEHLGEMSWLASDIGNTTEFHYEHQTSSTIPPPPQADHSRVQQQQKLNTILNPRIIANFMRRRSELGFFVDSSPYYSDEGEACLIPPVPLSFPLVNTVHVWALHISSTHPRAKSDYESFLLHRVLDDLSTVMSVRDLTQDMVIQYIQAQILLSQYFFRKASMEEGKTHAKLALSAALEYGLDSTAWLNSTGTMASSALPEDGGMNSAFQSAVTLYTCWALADTVGSPSPVDVLPTKIIWNSRNVHTGDLSSGSIMLFKATLLWQDACKYRADYHEDMSSNELELSCSQFKSLDSDIRQLIAERSREFNSNLQHSSKNAVIYTMLHVALIELHRVFVAGNPVSHLTAISAARSVGFIVNEATIEEWEVFDPILAILWTVICEFLIAEILAICAAQVQNPISVLPLDVERDLLHPLRVIMNAMTVLGKGCRLMELQALKLNETYMTVMSSTGY